MGDGLHCCCGSEDAGGDGEVLHDESKGGLIDYLLAGTDLDSERLYLTQRWVIAVDGWIVIN